MALKNLNAIVWLYRGEKDKYTALLQEYRKVLGQAIPFEEALTSFKGRIEGFTEESKAGNRTG